MTKYYVTGGLGVVGSRFARSVLADAHHVTILDAAEEPRNHWTAAQLTRDFGSRVDIRVARMETADLSDTENHDFVLHAAAFTGIPQSTKDPLDDWKSNVDATHNLLETFRKIKARGGHVPPTLALSSVKPYKVDEKVSVQLDDQLVPMRYVADERWSGIDESCVLSPDEPYAASKMAQSGLCMAYARSYDLPVTVYRCSNLYGPAPCHGPRHGWLTWFCISAALGWEIEVQGTGLQVRDMFHTDDITLSVLHAFKNLSAANSAERSGMLSMQGHVYNIGGGKHNTTSVLEAVEMLRQMCPDLQVRRAPGRKHEDPIFVTNISKLQHDTGWRGPVVSVQQGMESIYNWACQHREQLAALYKDT